jgi:membrane-bound metal-dependent hydrolase YbcI (DUF457 family)
VLAGRHGYKPLSQSIGFAVVASLIIAGAASRLAGLRFRHIFSVSLLTVLLHDILDMLQTTDRMPLWPFWPHAVGVGRAVIPQNPTHEGLLFAGLFVVFLVGWFALRRRARASREVVPTPRRLAWMGNLLAVAVFVLAGVTYVERSDRSRQLERAWALYKAKDYDAALDAFDRAERWPGAGLAGRIDYGRALIHDERGERDRSERHYLQAIEADPTNFWPLADLALFYVSSSEPMTKRRERVAPYLARLRREFSDEPNSPGVIAKLERKLAVP